ncbi:MAG: hypothetical protein JWM25_202 [Thermoleophilia bacterium]|nr:hypothetical protein [Thermoleophilia bacterium]MCZ4495619.1 hypothetical protein [Thermoleophilia bacterium]
MLHDTEQGEGFDEHVGARESNEHDQVGTVEVQILLSWFFETSSPHDVAVDVPRAA